MLGLTRIKKKYIIATLSNGTVRLLTDMAKHCGLPWDTVLGSDLVRHYKPDPEMYLLGDRVSRQRQSRRGDDGRGAQQRPRPAPPRTA